MNNHKICNCVTIMSNFYTHTLLYLSLPGTQPQDKNILASQLLFCETFTPSIILRITWDTEYYVVQTICLISQEILYRLLEVFDTLELSRQQIIGNLLLS
jgi:hypothetical protein